MFLSYVLKRKSPRYINTQIRWREISSVLDLTTETTRKEEMCGKAVIICLAALLGVAACFTSDVYGSAGSRSKGQGPRAGAGVGAGFRTGGSFFSFHGTYGSWGVWTACDVTCGHGSRSRVRSCIRPKYLITGTYLGCDGASSQTEACNAGQCKVDGGYSTWGPFGPINAAGIKTRFRTCTNPAPLNGGASCARLGPASDSMTVPINGGYTSWGPFGPVNADGVKTRFRTCTNPVPRNGGAQCVGPASDSMTVPINGGYSSWGPFGPINAAGIKTRFRTCTNPTPLNGGAQCVGPASDSMTVPINGGYSSWGPFGPINADGVKTRFRTCTNPAPLNGGAQCVGPSSDSMTVPVDGGYTSWGAWSSCSGSCGVGSRTRYRTCTAPAPLNGGNHCVGHASQQEDCKHHRPCSHGY